jgi:cation diffusion facilitator family transporter
MQHNFKEIKLVLVLVLILNWTVALAKIIAGSVFGIMSMVADGLHSFSDGSSNIIGLIGITAASKPVDETHPYGHKKIENFTALGITVLLLLVCYEIAQQAIDKFFHPAPHTVNWITFAVMLTTLAINYFVMKYEYKRGKELNSDILVSDSMHTQSDVLVSSTVIITLIGLQFGLWWIDSLGSLIVIGFILHAAFQITRHVFNVLVDQAAGDREKMLQICMSFKEVKLCHKLRTRGREDDIHVDLHISVAKDMNVEQAHALSHQIQEKLKGSNLGITDVVIHIEPCIG